jgi:transposase
VITAGQAADSVTGEEMIKEVAQNIDIKEISGDKAYDTNAIRLVLATAGKEALIPPKSNRIELILYDKEKYKKRQKVERFFGKIKEFRAIATRYDKLTRRFKAGLTLTMIAIFLKNSPFFIVNTA